MCPMYEFKNCDGQVIEELFSVDECPKEIIRETNIRSISLTEDGGVSTAMTIPRNAIFTKTISGSSFRLKGEGFHTNDYAGQ